MENILNIFQLRQALGFISNFHYFGSKFMQSFIGEDGNYILYDFDSKSSFSPYILRDTEMHCDF